MKNIRARTEAHFAKQYPETGGAPSGNTTTEIPELARYTEEQTNGMRRALAEAKQNGFDLGGANPLEDNESEPAKPSRNGK